MTSLYYTDEVAGARLLKDAKDYIRVFVDYCATMAGSKMFIVRKGVL